MNGDMLSQEEIDALLKGASLDDDLDNQQQTKKLVIDDYFSEMEKDTIGEIGNISFGSSATALSLLLNQKVDITTPDISVVQKSELEAEFPNPYVAVEVQYTVGISGTNLLVIKQSDAAIIADLMLGGNGINPPEMMNEIQLSAVQEAMNQMMGSAATSMSTIFNKKVDISPPNLDILDIIQYEGTDLLPDDDILIKVSFKLKVGDLIDSNIMQLLSLPFARSLVSELLPSDSSNGADISEPTYTSPPVKEESIAQSEMPKANESVSMAKYEEPSYAQSKPQQPAAKAPKPQPVNVQPAAFSSFDSANVPEPETRNLDMLLDIPLQVTVELGRTRRTVKDILELSSGSIVELDKLAGEPVDILINNKLIAKGEVVVIEENFGVRVTDIVSQRDRINKLS
ncbi:flagellar motor switch phosphatase FliY [Metabacillus iocasae]|uniref:Flagellar motor switch protein FliN/FliY n=1 Tax=Priestia iocasae TaxID=2291674 RepID=A0ABS2QR01_9BACI|nr:flagellar motor switch phosphatase FliY [Metabacillus iocasae]MBM7701875.1 flagellar motor switch protein FliN/FliY [Metabacillus iocasae]